MTKCFVYSNHYNLINDFVWKSYELPVLYQKLLKKDRKDAIVKYLTSKYSEIEMVMFVVGAGYEVVMI